MVRTIGTITQSGIYAPSFGPPLEADRPRLKRSCGLPRFPPYYNLPSVAPAIMRSYLVAFGLVALVLGLVLLLSGYERIGCTIGGSSSNPTVTNCNGATELEEAGAFLTVLAVILFAGALVPDRTSRYK
jgi:hypothetical protein